MKQDETIKEEQKEQTVQHLNGQAQNQVHISDATERKRTIIPFVKWVGGKRQLLPQIQDRMPEKFNDYYEPFIGGGALLFHLQPKRANINDVNAALINAYKQIRAAPEKLVIELSKMDEELLKEGKEYYYAARQRYNSKLLGMEYDVELASLLLFLNKHCFNGLYRENKKGFFNVPYNNSLAKSYDQDNIMAVSEYLRNVHIMNADFQEACENAKTGDFIFFDSPYAPINPTSFDSYTKEGFNIENHKRLAKLFDELTMRGCMCMLTNHNTDLVHSLYGNKGYKMDVVDVKRMINNDASKRVGEEIIICNYQL